MFIKRMLSNNDPPVRREDWETVREFKSAHLVRRKVMVRITRLNGKELVVNADLIETLEATPDTVITLTTGHKIIAAESIDEIIQRIVQYRQKTSILPTCIDSPTE